MLPGEFIWASGIEDTFVPHARRGYRALDEYELLGHYEHWREDLAIVSTLGLRTLRWGVPWYRVEPERGRFDWDWVDRVLAHLVGNLKITPIIDLIHYGCPLWMPRAFDDPHYPQLVANYAAVFAARYGKWIRWYTPLNEPLVTALFCGKRGLWPPYFRGERGYVRVLIQTIHGILATVAALKEIVADPVIVYVEATGLSRAARADLEVLAVEDRHRGYLTLDLLTGRVNFEHPLFGWLVRNGVSPDELVSISQGSIQLDVLGMNFYPQWSTVQLYLDRLGRLSYRSIEDDGTGFQMLIEDYYRRYRCPIMITETSARGGIEIRSRWLAASLAAVKRLRGEGVPVIGYTWFPLMTMIDWRYRYGRGPVENYRLDLGLYALNGIEGRWAATPLAEQFNRAMEDPAASIGRFMPAT